MAANPGGLLPQPAAKMAANAMGDWPITTIGEVASKVTKGTTPTSVGGNFSEGGINFVKVESIRTDGRIDHFKLAKIDARSDQLLSRSRLEPDDVLFTIAGTIGRTALVEGSLLPANTNQAVAIVRPRRERILPRFLYYLLRDADRIRHANTRVVQSVQANFSLAELSALPIPLPSLRDQEAIIGILGTVDDKIELNRRMSETLESMSRALFNSWFVDFDPVRAKAQGRPTGLPNDIICLFPGSFEESELGPIPSGWNVGSLLSEADLLSGGTPKTDRSEYWGGGISWASAKDVSQAPDSFLLETERTITGVGLSASATQLVPRLATVVVARGATTGRTVLFGREMAMNQTCYALVSKAGQPFTLNCVLRHRMGDLVHAAHGSVFNTITTSTFRNTPFVFPPRPLLDAFEGAVAPLFLRALSNVEESRTLSELRDALLPRLISGAVRVSDR